jgi:hypothetical protein
MENGVKYDGPFINLIMTHILTIEEMLSCSATGKKGRGELLRKAMDPVKIFY